MFSKQLVPIEKPDPPIRVKITHHSIELIWSHMKDKVGPGRFKYTLQQADKNKREWLNAYSLV